MNKIRRWLDRRPEALEKVEAPEVVCVKNFVDALTAELGEEKARAFHDLVKSHADSITCETSKDMEVLEFVEEYLRNPRFALEKSQDLRSNFHKSMLRKSCQRVAVDIASVLKNLSMTDLVKAVKAKDWNRVSGKQHPDAHLAVDHAPHMTQFPVHAEYGKMLAHPDKATAHKLEENGISAKMIHEVPRPPSEKSIYMAKPYHKKLESATRSWVKHPITGWATMATKALFNAGNIGHLAEDVSTHEHEGVPLTVHKFADDHKPIQSLMKWMPRGGYNIERTIDPVDVHKIGVMDYLANNLDRHGGNLMVGSHGDSRGYEPVLAIDHERNFQYNRPIRDSHQNRRQRMMFGGAADQDSLSKETPWAYIKGSVLNHAQGTNSGWFSHGDLVDWWNQHGSNIRDEMENQLGSIKDESIRKHVRNNFTERWHKMDQWAKRMAQDPESAHMYAPSALHEIFDGAQFHKQEVPKITSRSLKSLPQNKRDALFTIADMVNRKQKMTYKQHSMLAGAMDDIIDKMTPEEAAEALKSLSSNPYLATKAMKDNPELNPQQRMLRRLWQAQSFDRENNPVYKHDHMQAMVNAIESMPEEKRGMLSSWADTLRNRLQERRAAA